MENFDIGTEVKYRDYKGNEHNAVVHELRDDDKTIILNDDGQKVLIRNDLMYQ